jgi:hypothetical protein
MPALPATGNIVRLAAVSEPILIKVLRFIVIISLFIYMEPVIRAFVSSFRYRRSTVNWICNRKLKIHDPLQDGWAYLKTTLSGIKEIDPVIIDRTVWLI